MQLKQAQACSGSCKQSAVLAKVILYIYKYAGFVQIFFNGTTFSVSSEELHKEGINNCYLDAKENLIYVYGKNTSAVENFLDKFEAQGRLYVPRDDVKSAVAVSLDELDEQFDVFLNKMRRSVLNCSLFSSRW